MGRFVAHKEHLVRVAGLFAAGVALFLLVQAIFVPKGFGAYGHYRPGALDDVRARPLVYAGRAACLDCHTDVGATLKAGKHASIGCEACHGALARHVEDVSSQKAERPDGRQICLRCHLPNVAKPRGFPRVEPGDHAPTGSCLECHQAHSPALG